MASTPKPIVVPQAWAVGAASHGVSAKAVNTAPRVASQASASPSVVIGTSTALSVLGADDGSEANLRYTWSLAAAPAGVAWPIFSANGTNAARHTTATFRAAGTYRFSVTIVDAAGLKAYSSLSVTVNPTLTALTITPTLVTMAPGASQRFQVGGRDQFGRPMAVGQGLSWAATAGTITGTGVYSAPTTPGTYVVGVSRGTVKAGAVVTVTRPNAAPQIVKPAGSSLGPTVTGASTTLGVVASDDAGEAGLNYRWSIHSAPAGAWWPTFSANGTNGAKSTTATFSRAGAYTLQVSVTDAFGLSATSTLSLVVASTPAWVGVTPGSVTVAPGQSQPFRAVVRDQFATVMTPQPAVSWTATAGTMTQYGLYTAPTGEVSATITATVGPVSGQASVSTVNAAPVVEAIQSGPVPGSNTVVALSALATDEGGDPELTYTWAVVTAPPGAPTGVFSANGTNAARSTTLTLGLAGTYHVRVTATDALGKSGSREADVVVNPLTTSVVVTPGSVTLGPGQSQTFTASALDQFGQPVVPQPTFQWAATAGTMSPSGLFTAPTDGSTVTVTASAAGLSGSASVSTRPLANDGLNDPVLAGLVSTLWADGKLDRNDMIQVLTTAASAPGGVNQAGFSDLKSIVSRAASFGMPDYVRVLTSDVVNGSIANASFQGSPLGNLTVGSSADQMRKLVEKWFLGADHPALPSWGWTPVYARAAGSLFVNGPDYTDMKQGSLGDCYLIASLGSIATSNQAAIQNMFIDNGDDTWTVRFYAGGTADYVTVDRDLASYAGQTLLFANSSASVNNPGNELWIPLAEKAYAQWNETGKEGRDGVNAFSSIEGGWMSVVYNQVLGANRGVDYYPSVSGEQGLVKVIQSGQAVTAGTGSSPGFGLVGDHAYAIQGYDPATDLFTFINPWGKSYAPVKLNYAQILSASISFSFATTTGTVPASTAASVRSSADVSEVAVAPPGLFDGDVSTPWGGRGARASAWWLEAASTRGAGLSGAPSGSVVDVLFG